MQNKVDLDLLWWCCAIEESEVSKETSLFILFFSSCLVLDCFCSLTIKMPDAISLNMREIPAYVTIVFLSRYCTSSIKNNCAKRATEQIPIN